MPPPVIVFTPGAWHTTEYLATVIAKLEADGYKCVAVSLPSIDGVPPITEWEPDVRAVREAVLKECVSGKDVLVCCHSYSGLVVSSALEGLGKAERERQGKRSGIIKIAYVAAALLPVGKSMIDETGKAPSVGDSDGEQVTAPDPIPLFYNDLDPVDARYWASKLKPQVLVSFRAKATAAAHLQIPGVFLLCEDDRAMALSLQEALVQKARDAGASMETERVFSGHTPFLSKPDFVVEFLKRAAGGATRSV